MAYDQYDQLRNIEPGSWILCSLPLPIDNRTKRQKLQDKHSNNQLKIEDLQRENKEIETALELMSEHPIIERLDNLLTKLLR